MEGPKTASIRFSNTAAQSLFSDVFSATRGIVHVIHQPCGTVSERITASLMYVELVTPEDGLTAWHFSSAGEALRPIRAPDGNRGATET